MVGIRNRFFEFLVESIIALMGAVLGAQVVGWWFLDTGIGPLSNIMLYVIVVYIFDVTVRCLFRQDRNDAFSNTLAGKISGTALLLFAYVVLILSVPAK